MKKNNIILSFSLLLLCLVVGQSVHAQNPQKKERTRKMNGCSYEVLYGLAQVTKVEKVRNASESDLGYDEYQISYQFIPMEGGELLPEYRNIDMPFYLRGQGMDVPVGPAYLKRYQIHQGNKYAAKVLQTDQSSAACPAYVLESTGMPNDLFEARGNLVQYKTKSIQRRLQDAEANRPSASATPTPNHSARTAIESSGQKPTPATTVKEETIAAEAEVEIPEDPSELITDDERQRLLEEARREAAKQVAAEQAKIKAEQEEKEKELAQPSKRELRRLQRERERQAQARQDSIEQVRILERQRLEEIRKQKQEELDRIKEEALTRFRDSIRQEQQAKLEAEQAQQLSVKKAKEADLRKERQRCDYDFKMSGTIEIVEVKKVVEPALSLFNYEEYDIYYRFKPDNYDDLSKPDQNFWSEIYNFRIDPLGLNARPSRDYVRVHRLYQGMSFRGFARRLEQGICTPVLVWAPAGKNKVIDPGLPIEPDSINDGRTNK